MKTFIRVVEVWVPDAEQSLLEFGGGLYGSAARFGMASRSMCFGRGEGLPGRCWDEGRPIVLNELDPSVFRRTEQARAEGLTCGIALPLFSGDVLKAVFVIFCGDDDEHAGAIELWRNDPAESREMILDDGYYGTTADAFEFMSRRTSFHKGIGLPGMAWEAGAPVFLPDLGKSGRFLRADSAIKVGINRGFAFPIANQGDETYVLAFLSALATPLVRRLEVWSPAGRDGGLYLSEGFCETQGLLQASTEVSIASGQGVVGRAFATAVPMVTERAADEPGPVGTTGWTAVAALPVLRQGRVSAVVAWYF
jgi:GAF domain